MDQKLVACNAAIAEIKTDHQFHGPFLSASQVISGLSRDYALPEFAQSSFGVCFVLKHYRGLLWNWFRGPALLPKFPKLAEEAPVGFVWAKRLTEVAFRSAMPAMMVMRSP